MKTRIKKELKIIAVAIMLFWTPMLLNAQVLPSTEGVHFVCTSGTISLPNPALGTTWVIRYSETQTTTPTGNTIEPDNNQFTPSATGYYYLFSVNSDNCESDPQEIPIYVLAPLSVSLDGENYCSEDASGTNFTANITANDPNVNSYAYQWYIVNGTTETSIPNATSATYTPTETVPNVSTVYRVRAGYLIGGNKYCSSTNDKEITVLQKPIKPTITIQSSIETW